MNATAISSRDAAELMSAQPLATRGAGRWRGLVLPVFAILLWWLLARAGVVNSALLVSPEKVLATAADQVVTGKLWRALGASLTRELTGFAIGAVLGLALGVLLGLSPVFNRLVGPSFNTFKQISLFAWIPLISVWFGLGDTAKVVFLSLAALVPVVVNTCDGVRNTPPTLLEVARVYGYTRWQTFTQVVLPAAVPAIFTGVYLALIYSWLATIGAEYLLVAGVGIGNLLIEGSEHFQMDLVVFGMFVVGVIGWLMNALARLAERRLAHLRGQAQ
ncbi:Putative aliphatic sulfonates transport permease protein SsuC [Achromobacter pestifer]|uniref:Aliphatic sulfonates transport permease protein SsuC n=2 Tax=Achromobacter pestifer TaxID=1353889 RepID=A0A6S6YJD2_9BURK|nr:Putative aliphatic sulfonates transport permease protein SsuC [Achromobacter pestifer]